MVTVQLSSAVGVHGLTSHSVYNSQDCYDKQPKSNYMYVLCC